MRVRCSVAETTASDMRFTVRRNEGRYNLCSNEKDACYWFQLPGGHPDGKACDGIIMGIDSTWDRQEDDPFDALASCLEYARACIYNSNVKWLEAVSKFVAEHSIEIKIANESDELERLKKRKAEIENKIGDCEYELEVLKERLADAAIAKAEGTAQNGGVA